MKMYVAGVLAAVALGAALPASARSITGASFTQSGATTTVSVTFEAGESGDDHALYVAYDVQDRGATLAGWAAYQRVGRVAADATSATFTLLPSLTGRGYGICRVFLVESTYPFDTLIKAIRQTGTQYVDTGINAGPTTFVSLDFQFDNVSTKQQRIFGVASDDGTSLFSFDTYINGGGNWASACCNGKGDWSATGWAASPVRLTMSLDAATGLHLVSNSISHAVTTLSHAKSTRTATAAGAITLFARRTFAGGTPQIHLFAEGGLIYGGVISNENALARNYLPCESNGRAGLYDTVSGDIFWSAATNDDFLVGGGCMPCAPAADETLLAGSDALDLLNSTSGTFWKGSASGNWNGTDANWTVDGTPGQAWTDGSDATFNDSAASFAVTIPNGTAVTPASVTFFHTQGYTLAGEGGIAGTGTFVKSGEGTLTISGVNHSFTGDVLLAGGTTVLTGDKDSPNITSGALGNPRVARTVTVSNATLRVTGKNPFVGSGRSSTRPQAVLKLYNSTLDLPPDFPFNVGDHLHDSVVNFHYGLVTGTHWGSIAAENLYFSGTSPMTLIADADLSVANQQNVGLLLGKFAQATIDVPDITGNANVDAFIKMPIFRATANGADPGYPSGFRKTGAGTLELGGRDWQVGFQLSDYVGDVDVENGTLRMTSGSASFSANHSSAFGLTGAPHTFTVHPGATLQLAASDLQGQFYSTNAITLRVNGGTLAQSTGFVNGLGKLILENAKLTYAGYGVQTAYYAVSADGTETNHVPVVWPTFGFNGGVEFLGTNVYTLANGADSNGNHARLFFGTFDGKPSDCYVAEISGKGTADEVTDVTINARLQDAPPWYKYTDADGKRLVNGYNYNLKGLPLNMRKTGPGILQLNSKLSTTTGRIEVVEGTLKMGGGMGSSEANFECPTNTYLGDLRDPNRVALVLNGGTLHDGNLVHCVSGSRSLRCDVQLQRRQHRPRRRHRRRPSVGHVHLRAARPFRRHTSLRPPGRRRRLLLLARLAVRLLPGAERQLHRAARQDRVLRGGHHRRCEPRRDHRRGAEVPRPLERKGRVRQHALLQDELPHGSAEDRPRHAAAEQRLHPQQVLRRGDARERRHAARGRGHVQLHEHLRAGGGAPGRHGHRGARHDRGGRRLHGRAGPDGGPDAERGGVAAERRSHARRAVHGQH